jgi:hypothetical protein
MVRVLRLFNLPIPNSPFNKLDRSIDNLKDIRDSYRALNIEIYGEEMAKLLNDW